MCFYHFHFFFDEVSNFRNRILTNQKPEYVIRNCQWNSMLRLYKGYVTFVSMFVPIQAQKHVDFTDSSTIQSYFIKIITLFTVNYLNYFNYFK